MLWSFHVINAENGMEQPAAVIERIVFTIANMEIKVWICILMVIMTGLLRRNLNKQGAV
jgi:hypothetical protein